MLDSCSFLSNRSHLALQAMCYIVCHSNETHPLKGTEIESALNLPARKLEGILRLLARDSLLYSTAGANGGYYCPTNPDVTLADVIRCIEPKQRYSTKAHHEEIDRLLSEKVANAVESFLTRLGKTSLSDIRRFAQKKGIVESESYLHYSI